MNLIFVLRVIGLVGLLIGGLVGAFIPNSLAPFAMGFAVAFLNFWLLGLIWRRVLDKKPVATTLGLIVIKYSFLIGLLYLLVTQLKASVLPLLGGFATVVLGFLVLAFQQLVVQKSEE
jgi:hypothetical protein